MKTLFGLITILIVLGSAKANDVSCEVNVLKPKLSATLVQQESEKSADMTVAEARLRLKKSKQERSQQVTQTESASENKDMAEKPVKKQSGLGNMFDILLPSKLRDPAQ